MSNRAVEGKNATLKIKRNGVYLPYACATTFRLQFKTELIRRTSPGNGRAAKYMARETDATMELSGITHILPEGAMWTVFDLLEKSIRGDTLDVQAEFIDRAGNLKQLTAFALIPSIDIAAGPDGFSEDTITLQCSGAAGIFDNTIPDETNTTQVRPGYYEGSGGELGFTDPDTVGRQLLLFMRGDPLQIITTGTPNVQQVKHDSNTGNFYWSTMLDPEEKVFYLYQ